MVDDYPYHPRIFCKDGFNFSAQANRIAYCEPRDDKGPWQSVEILFPSEKDHLILAWADDPESPTRTVYNYVPLDIVDDLVEKHGGIDPSQTSYDVLERFRIP